MSNISVTTTQSVIEVTETGGITVTTPEGQTINVEVPNTSVDVTNTTDDITITEVGITNTDQLIEGTTNLFFTNARARSAISLTTDDTSILDYNSTTGVFTWDTPTTTKINEGTNLYYTTARANSDFDTRLATKTTTNLAEGANLYYTTARANTDFDTRLATKTTTNLAEGTNQYFTTARARQSLSAGTGISYDNSTGVITNTSINTDTTYTIDAATATGGANLNLVGSDSTTDTVKFASGTNITVSRTDANTITIDGTDLNTTYTISSASTTGGANLTLTGSDSSTDSVAYKGAGATTVTSTDANTVTITSTDTNTTYTQNASSTAGGANLNLVGSDSTTDSVKFASGTNVTVTRTDADTITIASTDTNTTYTQNFSSTTGGANLNLVGSDSTTDTVKFANGTGVTVSYTDADTATIAIGQSVGTGDNPTFAGITGGNVTVGVDSDQTISTSSGNLILQTATGTNAGTMTFTAGANGNITLAPNGTGDVVLTLADGSNLTNTRNYVKGVIRNSTLEAAGDMWAVNSTGPVTPYQGVSIDNSADTVSGPGTILRSFTGSSAANNANRGRYLFEKARGTSASPSAVQSGDFLGSIDASGYSSTGWINDTLAVVPAFFGFLASENWISNTNLGTSFTLSQAPQATTISSAANLATTMIVQPETTLMRGNRMVFSQATNTQFTATGCSTSGTTLTIGTVTAGAPAVGQVMNITGPLGGQYIIANISGSGSGSTWQMSGSSPTLSGLTVTGNIGFIGSVPATSTTTDILQDLRLVKNNIKSSSGTTQIVTSSAGATLELRGDTITLESSAGTDYLTLSSTGSICNQNQRTTISTASITEGATYTPAATITNYIELTINEGTGSPTSVIDVTNLTASTTNGAQYYIMCNNLTASSATVHIINSRISTNVISTHAITTTGEHRAMFLITVIGNYAGATHISDI
jgi:hypothetical protein